MVTSANMSGVAFLIPSKIMQAKGLENRMPARDCRIGGIDARVTCNHQATSRIGDRGFQLSEESKCNAACRLIIVVHGLKKFRIPCVTVFGLSTMGLRSNRLKAGNRSYERYVKREQY